MLMGEVVSAVVLAAVGVLVLFAIMGAAAGVAALIELARGR